MSIVEYTKISSVSNFSKEIINSLDYTKGQPDLSLFERKTLDFRQIVDAVFPTILIINYKDIENELLKYTDLQTAIEADINTTTSIPKKAAKLTKYQISKILFAIKQGVHRSLGSVANVSESYLNTQISNILTAGTSDSTTIARFKHMFHDILKIDSATEKDKDMYLFPNFNLIGNTLNKNINNSLELLNEEQQDIGIENIGEVLAYGHTAIGYKGNVQLNTPKLMQLIVDSISISTKTTHLTTPKHTTIDAFIHNTRQIDNYVTVSKSFSTGLLQVFVQLGGNVVRFENTTINSLRGTILEKTGNIATNKKVLAILSKSMTELQTIVAARIARKINYLLLPAKGSPSFLDYIDLTIINTLKGKNTTSFKGKDKLKSSKVTNSKVKVKIPSITGIIAKNTAQLHRDIYKEVVQNRGTVFSLANLRFLLDAQLQHVISANMGNGTERNILNYRTGRFASSVKVTKLSVSRENAITAFYTYMKYPYQTFEPGFEQGSKTRDPKLLISKSIREIAATKVGNRLRAVLI